MGTIGIPTKLLHESLGHVVTLELKGGQSYRGKLFDAEDNLNCSLKEVILTARDGKQTHLDSVYIRGSMIRFIVVPDMLQQAPMFKRVGPNAMKGRGIGAARGRATIMRGELRVMICGRKPVRTCCLCCLRSAYSRSRRR
jgi:small nuclear ribonucleoprotein D3